MTVGELIAELQKQPKHLDVQIVYDSAVCSRGIVMVAQWFPDAYHMDDPNQDRGPNCVGLFEESSARDVRDDNEDKRWPRRAVYGKTQTTGAADPDVFT